MMLDILFLVLGMPVIDILGLELYVQPKNGGREDSPGGLPPLLSR